MFRRLATSCIVGAVSMVALSGCASVLGAAPESQTSPGFHALDFYSKTLDGTYSWGDFLKGKPAVLWFWTPQCPICREEAPDIAKAAHAHPSVTFVGVAVQSQMPAIKEFVAKNDMTGFVNLADVDGAVRHHFDITQEPAFVFIGANGSAQIVRNAVTTEQLDSQLAALAKV